MSAPVKPEAPERQRIWFARCGADGCRYGRRNGTKLRTWEAADRHAFNYPGHNVIMSHWTPDGMVFDRVIQKSVRATLDYDGAPPF